MDLKATALSFADYLELYNFKRNAYFKQKFLFIIMIVFISSSYDINDCVYCLIKILKLSTSNL